MEDHRLRIDKMAGLHRNIDGEVNRDGASAGADGIIIGIHRMKGQIKFLVDAFVGVIVSHHVISEE